MSKKDIVKKEVNSTTAEQIDYAGPAYSPAVDIYSSKNELLFTVDLPGVKKGGVDIQVDETNTLIIKGKNSYQEPEKAVIRQYNVGNFYRAFRLSDDYDKEKVSAKFENGFLELTIPKREEVKPKRIQITA